MVSTEVTAARQGPLLALAVGGAARGVVDEIEDHVLADGAAADLNDGLGNVHRSGPVLLFYLIGRKFPEHVEATMLRTGLEFSSFTPRRDESVQMVF